MISLNYYHIRKEFTDTVIKFCRRKGIYIYETPILTFSNDYEIYNIHGDYERFNELNLYIEKLEKEREIFRKSKSFWWRLWH